MQEPQINITHIFMNPRLVVLTSLLALSVVVAVGSMWYIKKWQATPVPHQIMVPSDVKPAGSGIVEMPLEVPKEPVEVSKPQMKINIGEVCQGALAYMTFMDGVAADAFVEDCKVGKHPEVIEQYKANLNLGDGAAI